MIIQRFYPVAGSCYLLLQYAHKLYSKKINRRTVLSGNITFSLGVAWAFLWTAKKEESKVITTNSKPTILEKADDFFENGHYEECYKLLDNEDKEENNVEIQWRKTRTLYNMSKDTKYSKDTRKQFVLLAYGIISKQLQDNADHYAVHKWYALLLDAKSSYGGTSERIQQLENVKKHMDLAVTLNPKDATTLYMLGEWCYQISEMPWHQRKIAEVLFATPPTSTYEDALDYFLQAEGVQPRFYSLNLLRLGNCYMKLEKIDQARYYLKLAASYPAKTNDDHAANREATELLSKIDRMCNEKRNC